MAETATSLLARIRDDLARWPEETDPDQFGAWAENFASLLSEVAERYVPLARDPQASPMVTGSPGWWGMPDSVKLMRSAASHIEALENASLDGARSTLPAMLRAAADAHEAETMYTAELVHQPGPLAALVDEIGGHLTGPVDWLMDHAIRLYNRHTRRWPRDEPEPWEDQ